jgi:predicted dehydrogenase
MQRCSCSGSRRAFLRSALRAGGALALPAVLPRSVFAAPGRPAPNSRLGIGMIGLGRQAYHANLLPFLASPDTQVVALCDVDARRLEAGQRKVDDFYSAKAPSATWRGCGVHRDFRDVLARPDVDAVMISTPDHWHVYMAIAAAQAGKDVALEKPVSLSIGQGRALSRAMHRYGRIFRTDSECRFAEVFRRQCELVRNGRIGQVRTVHVGVPKESPPAGQAGAVAPPGELDYALWLGPAPEAPYCEDRVHPRMTGLDTLGKRPGWMQIEDYSLGMILNWGTHLLDIAQWGLNTERTGPVEVEGTGVFPEGRFWNVLQDFQVRYRYADGTDLHYTMAGRPYVRFEGADGWIEAEWWKGLTAHPETILPSKIEPDELHLPLISEKVDFIRSLKSRQETLVPAEVGHRTASLCQLGYLAIKLGRKLKWDPLLERFPGDAGAQALLNWPMRAPWTLAALGHA